MARARLPAELPNRKISMKYLLPSLLAIVFSVAGCAEHQVEKKPEVAVIPPVIYSTNSPGTKFGLLPSSVQRTITTQAGSAEIKDINKVTGGSSREVYEIKFRDPALNPTLYVAEDGTLISSGTYSYSGAPGTFGGVEEGNNYSVLKGLPYPVQRTLTEQAPKAPIVDVQKSKHTIYEIHFKDPSLNPSMLVTDEGVILKPSQ
jgi:hypothetical protein